MKKYVLLLISLFPLGCSFKGDNGEPGANGTNGLNGQTTFVMVTADPTLDGSYAGIDSRNGSEITFSVENGIINYGQLNVNFDGGGNFENSLTNGSETMWYVNPKVKTYYNYLDSRSAGYKYWYCSVEINEKGDFVMSVKGSFNNKTFNIVFKGNRLAASN